MIYFWEFRSNVIVEILKKNGASLLGDSLYNL